MNSNQLSKLALFLLLALTFFSCSEESSPIKVESNYNAIGLLTDIDLDPGETKVVVLDYFVEPELIDSISFDLGEVKFSDDRS